MIQGFLITKEFKFEAAHRLHGHPKCGRLHGHSYSVQVTLQREELGSDGMVQDYGDLAPIKKYIDENLDHRYLVGQEMIEVDDPYLKAAPDSDVVHLRELGVYRTTAEELARALYILFKKEFPLLAGVTVCETASTTASCLGGPDVLEARVWPSLDNDHEAE